MHFVEVIRRNHKTPIIGQIIRCDYTTITFETEAGDEVTLNKSDISGIEFHNDIED